MRYFKPAAVLFLVLSGTFLYSNPHWISSILVMIGTIAAAVFGSTAYLVMKLSMSEQFVSRPERPDCLTNIQKTILENVRKNEEQIKADKKYQQSRQPVITGQIDQVLDELFDLTIDDFIMVFLKDLLLYPGHTKTMIKTDLKVMSENLTARLAKIDPVQFITNDCVVKITEHFEKIRVLQNSVPNPQTIPVFTVLPHLVCEERERQYLAKLSELLVWYLLPPSYSKCPPVRKLVREVLANHVLFPGINKVTDPNYINTKLLTYIRHTVADREHFSRSWRFASSYETFLLDIDKNEDVADLKHIRYNIVSELMQATTINALNEAKGNCSGGSDHVFTSQRSLPELHNTDSFCGGDEDKCRHLSDDGVGNMKRYTQQLTQAKHACERRLQELGGVKYRDIGEMDSITFIPFQVVMASPNTRRCLYNYLETVGAQSLLGLWGAVQELREADKTLWHHLATQIFYTYINRPVATVRMDKNTLKRIESFLMGDTGPEVFFEIQDQVLGTIEKDHYSKFIMSEQYHQMTLECSVLEEPSLPVEEDQDEGVSGTDIQALDHSSIAKCRLEVLEEQLTNKLQAFQALQLSLRPDSRALATLEEELQVLEKEKEQVAQHLQRTESWCLYIGRWRCRVQSVEMTGDRESYHMTLVAYVPATTSPVHVMENEERRNLTSWMVARSLVEFHDLQKRLQTYFSWTKQLELPSLGKPLFGKLSDKAAVDKAKVQIQRFVDAVMADEKLSQSETVYTFLSPSPEYLKEIPSARKKSRFKTLSQFFKTGDTEPKKEKDGSDDDSFLLDDYDNKPIDVKDSIAEPLYALISEIFDMRGVFRWLRKTLVTFVQITFGRTISRQLSDTVHWMVSEAMVVYYLHLLKNSIWKNGKLKPEIPQKTPEQKQAIRQDAKEQCLSSIPEVLINLVGQRSARRGTIKLFETLQDQTLNKQLVYNLLEAFIRELIPELHKSRVAYQLNNFS